MLSRIAGRHGAAVSKKRTHHATQRTAAPIPAQVATGTRPRDLPSAEAWGLAMVSGEASTGESGHARSAGGAWRAG